MYISFNSPILWVLYYQRESVRNWIVILLTLGHTASWSVFELSRSVETAWGNLAPRCLCFVVLGLRFISFVAFLFLLHFASSCIASCHCTVALIWGAWFEALFRIRPQRAEPLSLFGQIPRKKAAPTRCGQRGMCHYETTNRTSNGWGWSWGFCCTGRSWWPDEEKLRKKSFWGLDPLLGGGVKSELLTGTDVVEALVVPRWMMNRPWSCVALLMGWMLLLGNSVKGIAALVDLHAKQEDLSSGAEARGWEDVRSTSHSPA